METDKLRYFTVIAQTENIRKAAEILHVSPSALSKTVRLLEEELGMNLLSPLGRGIVLTQEGRRLAAKAELILKDLEQIKSDLQSEKQRSKTNPLRIATFEVFSTYFLRALEMVEFEGRGLVLHEVIPGELERAVESSAVDLGITYLPIPHPSVDYLKVSTIEMGVFKRKGSFKGMKQEDLPYVVPVFPLSGAPTRIRGLDGWPEDAYDRKVLYEVTLMESALELCRQGRCAGFFPLFVIEEHNRKFKGEFQLERHPSPYAGRKCISDVFVVKRKDRVEDRDVKLAAKMIRLGTA